MATSYQDIFTKNVVPASNQNATMLRPAATAANPGLSYSNTALGPQRPPVPAPESPIIDGSTLGKTTAPNLPNQNPPRDPLATLTAIPTIEESIAKADEAAGTQTAAETEQSNIADRMKKAYEKLSGRATAQIEADAAAGLTGLQKQKAEINSQIVALKNEALAIPSIMQQNAQGRGVTAAGLAPNEAEAIRNNSIKALGLSALSQAVDGNIALAQQTADRAVELEFGPAQAELDYLKQSYEMNKDSLERYDSKRAAELKAYIDERERMLDEQKGDRKEIIKLATTALENGATMDIVNKMLNSKTVDEALLYSGTSLQKPDKTKATPDISLTPEDRRTLIGAGLTPAMIKQMEADVQQYGLNYVLAGIKSNGTKDDDIEAQKKAIQGIFGVKPKEESKLTRENLANLYGISDDNTKTDKFAWFFPYGKTNAEKLDELVSAVQRYQAVGQTDDEILAIIRKG